MKSLLLLFLVPITAFAQDTTHVNWPQPDEVSYKLFGSKKEYVEQNALMNNSDSKHLVRLIGFKPYWVNELSIFIQGMGFQSDADYSATSSTWTWKTSTEHLTGKFILDKTGRITSGVITGTPSALIDLFVGYWETTLEFYSGKDLYRGKIADKHLIGELIVFNWRASQPFITIKPN